MTDIIFHIGLPKAGSTFIQRNILHNTYGYMGKFVGCKNNRDHARQFNELTPHEDILIWKKRAYTLASNILEFKKKFIPNENRLIISHEGLSKMSTRYSQLSKRPIGFNKNIPTLEQRHNISSYLEIFNNLIWKRGNVKVLLILRNQPEWLASLYAQASDRITHATQNDFEGQINKLMACKDDYIDWSQWINNLEKALGKDKVCILLAEDMKKYEFWYKFANFMDIDRDLLINRTMLDLKKENVRSEYNKMWKLRPLKVKNRIYDKILFRSKNQINNKNDTKRDENIILRKDIDKKIKDYCASFNKRLEGQLNRNDLEKLGY